MKNARPARLTEPKGRRSKYNNTVTWVDGLRFDSAKEAARWSELRLLEAAGEIQNLRRQIPYGLWVQGQLIATYRADFVYEDGGISVVEDSKGVKTEVYRIKKKLMYALYNIIIKET